jgi:hypothetical protein
VDAPEKSDAPWVLFRSASGEGRGLLSYVTYVQLLGTTGVAPPAEVPQMGRRVEVPYAFYVAGGGTRESNKAAP